MKLLGCLIKGPLGCLAFLLGATVVFVIFLPPACGNVVSQELEIWFADNHLGSLAIKKAWLGSVYGEQKMEGISLRDPSGGEIFNALVTAPSIDGFFADSGTSWGPVEIQIPSVTLIEYADGTSNLDRALARRLDADGSTTQLSLRTGSDSVSVGPFAYGSNVAMIDLLIRIERLSWTAVTEEVLVLQDIECDGQLQAENDRLRLELSGRGVFADGLPDGLVFDLAVDSFERWANPGAFLPWHLSVELKDAPVLALEAPVGREGEFGQALGEVVRRFSMVLLGESPEVCRIDSFELSSTGASVSLVGDWRRGEERLIAADDDSIYIGFPVDSWWTREVVGTLLPLMDDVQLTSSNGFANLILEEFAIPLGGNLWRTSAHATVQADTAVYQLPPAIAGELLLERKGVRQAPFVFELAGGRAAYASFPVSTEKGELEVRGELDLETRTYDLRVKTPDGKEYGVEGKRDAPSLRKQN